MSVWQLANFVNSTLAQAVTAAATTIYIDPDDATDLPTLGSGEKAKGVLFNSTSTEIVNITAVTLGALTVQRAQEGTTAIAWGAGTKFVHTPTAEVLQEVLDAVQGGRYTGTATGTDTITVTTTGSVPPLADGDEISFEVANTNTGAVTLSRTNGTTTVGPYAVVKEDRTALAAGELVAGYRVAVTYDASSGHLVLTTQGSKRYHVTHVNGGPLAAGNLLPNGGFDAWNAATSFSSPASGTTTADNAVISYDGTIGTFSVSRQTFTLGQTDVPGGPKYFYRWDHSSAGSGSSYRKIRMKLPRVGKYALETLVASVYAKADVARNVTAKLIQSFGTGGSPSAEVTIVSETWVLSTSFAQYDLTSVITSIAGKTLGSDGNDGLILELGLPVNTTMTMDFAMAGIEFGTSASKTHSRLPWETEQGGTGGSYATQALLAAALEAAAGGWLGSTDIGVTVQAYDAGLEYLNSLNFTNEATFKAGVNLEIGTDVQAYDAGLAYLDGLNFTNEATFKAGVNLEIGVDVLAYDADVFYKDVGGTVTALVTAAERWTFTKNGNAVRFDATTGASEMYGRFSNSGGNYYFGLENSAGGALVSGASAYAFCLVAESARDIILATNNTERMRIGSAGGVTIGGNTVLTTATGAQLAATNTFTSSRQIISTTAPMWELDETDGGSNQRFSRMRADSGVLHFDFVNDAYNSAMDWLSVTRSANTPLVAEFDTCDLRIEPTPASLATNSAGFRGIPSGGNRTGNYTFVLADAGQYAYYIGAGGHTFTIPPNSDVAFPVGTVLAAINASGAAFSIAEGAGVSLNRGDGTAGTGTRTVAAAGIPLVAMTKIDTNAWTITGAYT